ncbi:MAG TPA: carotenoid biosynthesis protein [Actinomycetes bacterium]|nr:carotenoid biosynthesis protein [Actinomycetes bacterium]
MSQRHYTGPSPSRGPSWIGSALAWVLAVAVIGLNIAYPIADASNQVSIAIASVYVFYFASLVHAAAHRGPGGAILVGLVVPVIGWVAESVGSHTGWPFGHYTYSDVLGPSFGDVPLVVPLAWTMIAYPTYVAARALTAHRWLIAVIGAWSLMAWDMFLEPMMVKLGAWSWRTPDTTIPGLDGIPALNFAGWFAVGLVVIGALTWLPRPKASIAQPAALYLWVFVSSIVANVFYFDRPEVAIVGGIAMGVVALPFAWRLWVNRT